MGANDITKANPPTKNYFSKFFFLSSFVNHRRYIDSKFHIIICFLLHAVLGKVNIYFESKNEIILLRKAYQI